MIKIKESILDGGKNLSSPSQISPSPEKVNYNVTGSPFSRTVGRNDNPFTVSELQRTQNVTESPLRQKRQYSPMRESGVNMDEQ